MSSITLTLGAKNRERENNLEERIENRKKMRKELSPLLTTLILPPLQGFSSRETDFHLCQFLSNFLSSHLYSNFTIYFSGKIPLLNSFSPVISIFSYLLTSALSPPLNSFISSLAFSKSSSFSHESCSIVNFFHRTRYLSTPLIFLLFNILSTSHSLAFSTSIGFPSSFFCPPTYSLYCTIRLTFTTG